MTRSRILEYEFLYIIFVVSIAMTLFTAIRLPNIPIGIGEILLLIIGVYMFLKNYRELNYKFFKDNLLLKFWFISFILLLVGFIVSYFFGNLVTSGAIVHDTAAYGFIFLMLITLSLFQNKLQSQLEVFEKFIYLSLIFYSILFVFFLVFSNLTLDKGHWGPMIRYSGMSYNPNQFALLFTVIPFMFLYFHKILIEKYFFSFTVPLVLLSIFIGMRIGSDALNLAWLFALIIYLFLIYITKYSNFYVNILLLIIAISVSILILFNLKEIIFFIDGGPSSASGRIELIFNAFNDLDKMFYFGFGPGPHSYLNSLANQFYSEVHNTHIDWFTQTGIIGLFLYFYIIYNIIRGLYIKKEWALVSAFSSLLIFSTFHFTFRQPIFWFFIFFFYIMSQGDKRCVQ